jgi:co-chaperonin GroES (HSP10)
MKLKPVGSKLLVEQIQGDNYVTEGKIELVETAMAKASVVEVSDELARIYNIGDVVMFPEKIGTLQMYNGKKCLWVNGDGYPKGDVWAIVK